MLALEGIKVLDMTRNAPGQFCTMILGDLGADVLKVERPILNDGDGPQKGTATATKGEDQQRMVTFNALERNKRSISLNLRHAEARNIFYQLSKDADVIIEGFRPGVVKRLGVDYDTVKDINPRIVYCSLSGYGQDGPYRDMTGHDINYISLAGVLGLIGAEEEGRPAIPMNLIADYAGGGLASTIAILAAVIAREKTGRGQYLDIAMTENVFYMLGPLLADYFNQGIVPERMRMRLNGGNPDYNVYRTSDGKYLSIAALEPWFWENLCRTLGREDMISRQRAQGEERQEVFRFLSGTFLTKTRDEWFELLKDKDISVGKVYSLDEAINDPQIVDRGMVVEVETPDGGTVKQPGIAIHLSDTPGEVRHTGPVTGQHTREVLLALGYTQDRVDDLIREEAIQ